MSDIFGCGTLFVLLAALLDIFANLCVAASRGFTRFWYAVAAYILVGSAFYSLSLAVRTMDLAVAYAMWGVFGLTGTVLGGWIMLRQVPGPVAWLGMGVMVIGIILLH